MGPVCALVVLAHRTRRGGVFADGVPAHPVAGLVGHLREDVLVRNFFRAGTAVMSSAFCGLSSRRSSSASGSAAGNGTRSCSGIAACWWGVTSYMTRPVRRAVRSWAASMVEAMAARSWRSGMRGMSQSPSSDGGGGGGGGVPGRPWAADPGQVRTWGGACGWMAGRPERGGKCRGGTRHEASDGLGFADVHAVRGEGGIHDLFVQAGVAAAAGEYEGEVAAGFGEQLPTVETIRRCSSRTRPRWRRGPPGQRRRSGRPGPGSRRLRRGRA